MKSKIHIAIQRKKNTIMKRQNQMKLQNLMKINNSNRFNPYKQVDEKNYIIKLQILMKTKY